MLVLDAVSTRVPTVVVVLVIVLLLVVAGLRFALAARKARQR